MRSESGSGHNDSSVDLVNQDVSHPFFGPRYSHIKPAPFGYVESNSSLGFRGDFPDRLVMVLVDLFKHLHRRRYGSYNKEVFGLCIVPEMVGKTLHGDPI